MAILGRVDLVVVAAAEALGWGVGSKRAGGYRQRFVVVVVVVFAPATSGVAFDAAVWGQGVGDRCCNKEWLV